MTTSDTFSIFPTPVMRVPGALPPALVAALVAHFSAEAVRDNNSSAKLVHTRMLEPVDSPLLVDVASLLA